MFLNIFIEKNRIATHNCPEYIPDKSIVIKFSEHSYIIRIGRIIKIIAYLIVLHADMTR